MADTLRIDVPGPPVPKARARKGKGGRWYTPPRTRQYEAHVRTAALAARQQAGGWPTDARYEVQARICFPDRRRRDGDNVVKSLLDAANGVLWDDDSQVVRRTTEDTVDRERPRVEMVVRVVGEESA